MRLVRIQTKEGARWGELEGEIVHTLKSRAATLADFLSERSGGSSARDGSVAAASAEFLSPVTECQIVCQGKNYQDHIREIGMKPSDASFNLFFTKAASTLAGPGVVRRPNGVKLLDYELELALVIGRAIDRPIHTTPETLHEYVAGVTIANDVSARDFQIPRGQWFHGKSFRGFCPVGPVLHLLSPGDRIDELNLELRVNKELRQKACTRDMIYHPHETLNELSTIMNLNPGDIVLTGTPGGVALKAPSGLVRRVAGLFLNEKKLMETFVKKQMAIREYLKDGDVIHGTIQSKDGTIDLGTQTLKISG